MRLEILSLHLLVVASLFIDCKKSSNEEAEPCTTIEPDNIAIASRQLTLPDAEVIMGEPAALECNTFVQKTSTLQYTCAYTALSVDQSTGKTGKLYYMSEVYSEENAAKNAYAEIYEANRRHDGVEIVQGLGDEAYYHSDGENFYFFLVRKDEKMFRLKLNKVTSHSSVTNFKEVVRIIVDRM